MEVDADENVMQGLNAKPATVSDLDVFHGYSDYLQINGGPDSPRPAPTSADVLLLSQRAPLQPFEANHDRNRQCQLWPHFSGTSSAPFGSHTASASLTLFLNTGPAYWFRAHHRTYPHPRRQRHPDRGPLRAIWLGPAGIGPGPPRELRVGADRKSVV